MASQRERAAAIRARLERAHPDAHCTLDHKNPFQLLIATILAAQCTDERVNLVTPALFRRYPDPKAFARADPADVQEAIRTTGFFRNKTKSILGASRRIAEAYNGRVPRRMDDLLTLPGVARKTANVVLGVAYGIPAGFVVDTHVKRLAFRLGLTRATDPDKVEKDLCRLFKEEAWIDLPHLLIFHGRRVCKAKSPLCGECRLAEVCPRRGLPRAGRAPAREAKRQGGALRASRPRAGKRRQPPR